MVTTPELRAPLASGRPSTAPHGGASDDGALLHSIGRGAVGSSRSHYEPPGFNASAWNFKVLELRSPGPFQASAMLSPFTANSTCHRAAREGPARDVAPGQARAHPSTSACTPRWATSSSMTRRRQPVGVEQVANMLYLESPAGSGRRSSPARASACFKGGKQVGCHWDDVKAEAYASPRSTRPSSSPRTTST